MEVLLIGSNRGLGNEVLKELIRNKIKVNCLVRKKGLINFDNPNVKIFYGDATNFDDLKKAFPDEWHADKPNQRNRAVFVRLSDAEQLFKDKGHRRHFFKEGEVIQLSDEIIAVSNQWGIGNIGNFVDGANQSHNSEITK